MTGLVGRSISFDCVASRYDDTRGGERRGEQFAADVAPMLDGTRPLLEIGIGTGVIAKAMRSRGFTVRGIDISHNMLERARDRVGNVIVRGDAMELPFATASLDQALSVWVLHVVGDVATVMHEIARVLRPGGTYLVMDGHKTDDPPDEITAAWHAIEAGFDRPVFAGRIHEFANAATACGFHVQDVVTTGPYPYSVTVADTIMRIETRSNSWMWSVSDDEWKRVVAPVLERLRSVPDPERPIPREDYQDVLILRT